MTNQTNVSRVPHQRLIAYTVARELVIAVRHARISNAALNDQALRAALAVGLNIAEATARRTPADQRRVYAIARGEASEALAAFDLAEAAGFCSAEDACVGMHLAERAYALLSGLMRAAS